MDKINKVNVNRRDLLRMAGLAGLAAAAAPALAACGSTSQSAGSASPSGSQTPAKVINALCWEGYTDESITKGFTAEYGTEIKSTFIGSNDELVAQLTGGGSSFDLISPSVDTTKSLIDAALVQPLNKAWVPNLDGSYDQFKSNPAVQGPGGIYGVPMCWGYVPLILDKSKVTGTVDSWNVLWDANYTGKITVWDDITTVYNTALVLGFRDVYNLTDDQLNQVKAKLLEQKPLVKKYWATGGELTNLFASGEVVLGDSFGGFTLPELQAKGIQAVEILPKEGATAWVDFWMVPAKSDNLYTAELWMNYIQRPEIQAAINKVTGYAPTSQGAAKLVPAAVVDQYSLNDPAAFDRLLFWEKVADRQKYLDVLTEVKSA